MNGVCDGIVVRNATWSPTYELQAESENGKPASAVSLHYRARITQSTGEDWTNVALTLSTAAMDRSDQRIPDLKPIRICPPTVVPLHGVPVMTRYQIPRSRSPSRSSSRSRSPLPVQEPRDRMRRSRSVHRGRGSALGGLFGRSLDALNDDYEDLGMVNEEEMATMGLTAPSTPPPAFTEPGTIVNASPLSMSYRVEGKSSIPSDGVAHNVSIAQLQFEAEVAHIAVPRVKAIVYLQVRIVLFVFVVSHILW